MTQRIHACALAAILIGATVVWARAQQTPTPQFRTGTTLVEFTIVATDERGRPVTDLKQDEIEVIDRGKPRPVDFFRFEGAPFAPGAKPVEEPREPVAPGIFTNRAEYSPGPPRNVTAMVIDTLNTLAEDQVAVRASVMRYLRALAPNTRVAIYSTGERLRVLHDFTDDLESLRTRLAKMPIDYHIEALSPDEAVRVQELEAEHLNQAVDDPNDDGDDQDADEQADQEYRRQLEMARSQMARLEESFYEQLHRKRIDMTLRSLEAIGNHLSGIAGRKNLVWISGGVPVLTYGARDRWTVNYEPQIRAAAQRLASQNIAVYAVQASALRVGLLGTASTAEGASRGQTDHLRPLTRESDQRLWSTMDVLAEVTGGRSFKNTNDLAAGVTAAESDMRASYSLGFYVPDNDERWRDLRVRVRRPGVRVLHRKGYMALGPVKQPRDWTQDEWQAAVQNPLGSTAIRLDARVDVVDAGLNVLVQIAADDLYYRGANGQPVTELEIGFAERNRQEWTRVRRDGATITLKENAEKSVRPSIVRFSKMWTINPDTTAIRLVVRDRLTGRFGCLDLRMDQLR
jgi:VWFA-related protein